MSNTNAIEIRNMSKSFKIQRDGTKSIKDFVLRFGGSKMERHEVLKNISLDIKKGETVALIGVNGSGKSTLLKLMTKIIYPTSGTVKTYGKLTSLLELGAGFHPDFTGRENIYFNASIFGLTKEEINNRIDDIIVFSELGEAIEEPIRTYSSGMYMRLAFSIAINVDAEILLIDEILAVGDQHFQEKCFAKLKELRDNENKTIVIVSHSLDVVKDLCTRAVWLYNGEFALDGDPTYVVGKYLEQVEKDNRDRKIREVASGKAEYNGVIFIDSPQNYEHYSINEKVEIRGWQINDCNDCDDAEFNLFVGNEKISYKSMPRKDVLRVYHEQYGGFMDPEKVGFQAEIVPTDYEKQITDKGTMVITAQTVLPNGKKLEKDVKIIIDREA
ncbi:MAG: ABC transporter ATP-binding protein [Bulleidia sp.]